MVKGRIAEVGSRSAAKPSIRTQFDAKPRTVPNRTPAGGYGHLVCHTLPLRNSYGFLAVAIGPRWRRPVIDGLLSAPGSGSPRLPLMSHSPEPTTLDAIRPFSSRFLGYPSLHPWIPAA